MYIIHGDPIDYYRLDSINKIDANNSAFEDLYDTEFLNTIKVSRVPNHKLTHKVGTPI